MEKMPDVIEKQEKQESNWFEGKGIFCDQFGNRLIEVTEINGKKKIMKIDSDDYKRYLRRQSFINQSCIPEEKDINKKVKMMDAMAEMGPVHELHQRIAQSGETLYFDLANGAGHIVEITAAGWKVLQEAPVRFQQKDAKALQVMPVRTSLDKIPSLFDFVNIQDSLDQLLFEVTMVTCLIPEIAHPVISLIAREGSAKTTACRVLKALVDPAVADLIAFPTKKFDLGLCCSQNHLVGFDNMRDISKAQSDLLCQAVTGGNICVRKLHTTSDTVTIPLKSCLVLNGIDIAGYKTDLIDRTIVFSLPRIDPSQRKDEKEFWKEFNAAKPMLLGHYFDVLARSIQIYPDTKPESSPRMADYYRWALAVTKALGRKPEEFEQAYQTNIDRSAQDSVEKEPLAAAVSSLVEEETCWQGTISELHVVLGNRFDSRQLPKAPNQLSRELKLVTGTLGKVGIAVEWDKDRGKNLTTVRLAKAS